MIILKLCCIAVITAICALVLQSHKSELVPLCITAGGILLILYAFDYIAESINFIKEFTEQTNIDSSVVRLILKIVGVGYLIELTSSSVKDLGFTSIADKLVMCGKLIIFVMSLPVLKGMFNIIISLINLV
jgi:stage III sporulation protein AD